MKKVLLGAILIFGSFLINNQSILAAGIDDWYYLGNKSGTARVYNVLCKYQNNNGNDIVISQANVKQSNIKIGSGTWTSSNNGIFYVYFATSTSYNEVNSVPVPPNGKDYIFYSNDVDLKLEKEGVCPEYAVLNSDWHDAVCFTDNSDQCDNNQFKKNNKNVTYDLKLSAYDEITKNFESLKSQLNTKYPLESLTAEKCVELGNDTPLSYYQKAVLFNNIFKIDDNDVQEYNANYYIEKNDEWQNYASANGLDSANYQLLNSKNMELFIKYFFANDDKTLIKGLHNKMFLSKISVIKDSWEATKEKCDQIIEGDDSPEAQAARDLLQSQDQVLNELGNLQNYTGISMDFGSWDGSCGIFGWDEATGTYPDGSLGGFIQKIYNFIKYGAVVILVVFGIIDFAKAVVQGDNDALKKAGQSFGKRIAAVVFLLLLPLLLNYIFTFIDGISDPTCHIK